MISSPLIISFIICYFPLFTIASNTAPHTSFTFPSSFLHISFLFPSYFLHLSLMLPSYFLHISFKFPSYYLHISVIIPSYLIDITYIPIVGVILAFLILNWYPSKIFMGDIGSTFLGIYFLSNLLALDSLENIFRVL